MKYPFEKQRDLKDCGVCSLQMLVRYYGGGISREYLREITNTSKNGVSAYDLVEAAKKIGFDSYGVRGNILSFPGRIKTPCIAHVIKNKSYQHFIVIYKIDQKKHKLIIADPVDNRIKKIFFLEFNKISTNNYIFLKPRKKLLYVEKNNTLKKLIIRFIYNNYPELIKIFLTSFIFIICEIILTFQFKIILNYVINYQTAYNIILLILLFISLILLKELCNFHRNKRINELNHSLDKSLSTNVYNHLLSLPYLYYKNRTTGEVVSRMNDLVSIRNVISKFLVCILIDLVLLFGSLLCLFFLSKDLTIIVVVTVFLLIILYNLFNKSLEEAISKVKNEYARYNSLLVESLKGIETIKALNLNSFFSKKFLLNYSYYNKNSLKTNDLFLTFTAIKNIICNLSNLFILILGSYYVIQNKLDIALLITFISLANYVYSPIESFLDILLSLKEAKISYDRIRELYEVKEEIINNSKSKCNLVTGDIKTDHLKYSYNNHDLFLKDINLDIKNNSRILIYGKSGSGKSTLAKILAGIINIDKKYLYFNDKDINNYSTNALRKDICYVSNNELLLTDTIYNNIVLDKDISEKEFDEDTKICMVDEIINNKSLAYDTLLEEDGFNISSGEKQRIILARSLLKDSNIYILDEALNQVDIKRERQILTNLFKKYPNKTFIYISHRFHNDDLFDKKYRIEDGISYDEAI